MNTTQFGPKVSTALYIQRNWLIALHFKSSSAHNRSGDHAPENVIPACQLTLKNLQLDYLDLYLIHGPIQCRKGASFPFKEEDIMGYSPEAIGKCWEVSQSFEIDPLISLPFILCIPREGKERV